MARQNLQSKSMIEAVTNSSATQLQQDVMIVFTGTHHHYVTPKFYTETKPATSKVVPTWNYSAVEVYGKATVYYDSSTLETSDYQSKQIHDLSQLCETSIMGYTGQQGKPELWSVTEAPEKYIDTIKKNIIGVEITIESITGKFKMSQELCQGDRDGVIEGFSKLESDVGTHIAAMVKERGDIQASAKNGAVLPSK
ncbi:hypothetical protein N7495_002350 [Penicillium taxi]|uniref:uncharacterized protein n=1 Tax=Penicillium taxi TaxID=168475 RepID=UPI002545ABD0|nr:uncharacterized protein N7495_002350 [Penicillium taxi]KAJ5901822.1 hypothetical protein N7495_002350 [Penicillium taxi]